MDSPSTVFGREFSDFDSFSAAARGWELDFLQLDRGDFRAIEQCEIAQMLLPHHSAPNEAVPCLHFLPLRTATRYIARALWIEPCL